MLREWLLKVVGWYRAKILELGWAKPVLPELYAPDMIINFTSTKPNVEIHRWKWPTSGTTLAIETNELNEINRGQFDTALRRGDLTADVKIINYSISETESDVSEDRTGEEVRATMEAGNLVLRTPSYGVVHIAGAQDASAAINMITGGASDLSGLATTTKTSVLAAVNELADNKLGFDVEKNLTAEQRNRIWKSITLNNGLGNGYVHIDWFKLPEDGDDWTQALIRAQTVLTSLSIAQSGPSNSYSGAYGTVEFGRGPYKFGSTNLEFIPIRFNWKGNRTVFDFSHRTEGNFVAVTVKGGWNWATCPGVLSGIEIQGPGKNVVGSVAVLEEDTGATAGVTGVGFRDIIVKNFASARKVGVNAYINVWDNFTIGGCGKGVDVPVGNGANNGERMVMSNGVIAQCDLALDVGGNGTFELMLNSVSLDHNVRSAVIENAVVDLINGHIEDNGGSQTLIETKGGPMSRFTMRGGSFVTSNPNYQSRFIAKATTGLVDIQDVTLMNWIMMPEAALTSVSGATLTLRGNHTARFPASTTVYFYTTAIQQVATATTVASAPTYSSGTGLTTVTLTANAPAGVAAGTLISPAAVTAGTSEAVILSNGYTFDDPTGAGQVLLRRIGVAGLVTNVSGRRGRPVNRTARIGATTGTALLDMARVGGADHPQFSQNLAMYVKDGAIKVGKRTAAGIWQAFYLMYPAAPGDRFHISFKCAPPAGRDPGSYGLAITTYYGKHVGSTRHGAPSILYDEATPIGPAWTFNPTAASAGVTRTPNTQLAGDDAFVCPAGCDTVIYRWEIANFDGGLLPARTGTARWPSRNTGNGTLSAMSASGAADGLYLVTFTSATAFVVTDPDGLIVGSGTVGSAFNAGGLQFTVTAGGTAFAAQDTLRLQVSGTTVTNVTGGNAGLNTISAITVADNTPIGAYPIVFTSATAFTVYNPDGTTLGTGTAGTAFSAGGLGFTLSNTTPAHAAGDKLWIWVTCSSIPGTQAALHGLNKGSIATPPGILTGIDFRLGNYVVTFTTPTTYTVTNPVGETLGTGRLGVPFFHSSVTFTIPPGAPAWRPGDKLTFNVASILSSGYYELTINDLHVSRWGGD